MDTLNKIIEPIILKFENGEIINRRYINKNAKDYLQTIENFKEINFGGLSIPEKIEKINSIILTFPLERKIDICRYCRAERGDLKQYNVYIQDGSMCSLCLEGHDVLNYSIVELVELAGLKIEDFYFFNDNGKHYHGLRKSCDVNNLSNNKYQKQDILGAYAKDQYEQVRHIANGKAYFKRKKELRWPQKILNNLFIRL